MTSYRSLSGQAFRLLCVCMLMAFTVSLFAQEGQKKWADMLTQRQAEINLNLQKAGEKIIIAGDSHAAFTGDAGACDANVVNAGANGATTSRYLELLEQIRFKEKAQQSIVLIGTNDTYRKRAVSLTEFRANAEKIIWNLSRVSERVVVAALPPISMTKVEEFDDAKANEFSSSLQATCKRFANCTFSDPHRDFRDPDRPGTANSDSYMSADGVHLANYRALTEKLSICPAVSAANFE